MILAELERLSKAIERIPDREVRNEYIDTFMQLADIASSSSAEFMKPVFQSIRESAEHCASAGAGPAPR